MASARAAAVTVITHTRGRPDLLIRAMRSVRSQTAEAHVDHLIVVDDDPHTAALLEDLEPGPWRWTWAAREPGERSGTARLARMRNRSVAEMTDARWVAFLDDDNRWRDDHLATLLECARRTGRRAVHCHRSLRTADGGPYLEPLFPWASSPTDAHATYLRAVEAGAMSPGSPLLCTGVSSALPAEFRFVDMGEWLSERPLLLEVPLVETFTPEQELVVGEDDLWLEALLERGEPIGCTGRATLDYFLGGMTTVGCDWLSPGRAEVRPAAN